MLLLVVDTSDKQGTIALALGHENGSCDIIESVSLAGGMFSAQLVPQVAALLSNHGFDKQELAGFIAVSGPGSFTGLRVGLAAVKGLAEVLKKPIATVSLLEVVAVSTVATGNITVALEAGREEVFVANYEVTDVNARLISEKLMRREVFVRLSETLGLGASKLITTDVSSAEMLRAQELDFHQVEKPSIASVASLGWKKILSGTTVGVEFLEADYVGRSDSEIFSGPKP